MNAQQIIDNNINIDFSFSDIEKYINFDKYTKKKAVKQPRNKRLIYRLAFGCLVGLFIVVGLPVIIVNTMNRVSKNGDERTTIPSKTSYAVSSHGEPHTSYAEPYASDVEPYASYVSSVTKWTLPTSELPLSSTRWSIVNYYCVVDGDVIFYQAEGNESLNGYSITIELDGTNIPDYNVKITSSNKFINIYAFDSDDVLLYGDDYKIDTKLYSFSGYKKIVVFFDEEDFNRDDIGIEITFVGAKHSDKIQI